MSSNEVDDGESSLSESVDESGTDPQEDVERDQSTDEIGAGTEASRPTVTVHAIMALSLLSDLGLPPASVTSEDSKASDEAQPEITQQEREKQYATLLASMNETELDRYEAYRRSCLPRPKMKKLMASLSHLPVHDDKILIVICSLAKMFVGEIIQESRSIAASMGERGALRPHHVRQAFKKLESEGSTMRRRSGQTYFRHCAC